jgi:hypothetical protein
MIENMNARKLCAGTQRGVFPVPGVCPLRLLPGADAVELHRGHGSCGQDIPGMWADGVSLTGAGLRRHRQPCGGKHDAEFLLFAELGVRRHVVREPVSVCGMSKRNWKMAGNWPLQNLGLGPEILKIRRWRPNGCV